MTSEIAMIDYSMCGNSILCRLINKQNPEIIKQNSIQAKSYYNVGVPSNPAYYPAFDPISVLASLAFLAFLLQSFASLFDRSRSILPTVMSARESSDNIDAIENKVVTALQNYANLETTLWKNNVTNKTAL